MGVPILDFGPFERLRAGFWIEREKAETKKGVLDGMAVDGRMINRKDR
jgi:hypothetical protein